jgi:hypothetical protein
MSRRALEQYLDTPDVREFMLRLDARQQKKFKEMIVGESKTSRWEAFSDEEVDALADLASIADEVPLSPRAEVLSAQIKAERDKRAARLDRWQAFTINELRELLAGAVERHQTMALPDENRSRAFRLAEELRVAIDDHPQMSGVER